MNSFGLPQIRDGCM